MMAWTDESIATAKKLWSDGLSAGRIAAALQMTRNQVIGKLYRLGLTRASPVDLITLAAERRKADSEQRAQAQAKRTGENVPAPAAARPKPKPMASATRPPIPAAAPKPAGPARKSDEPGPRSATLLNMAGGCMYPVGTASGADQIFCGELRAQASSYCARHANVCGGQGASAKDYARSLRRWA